MRDFKRSVLVGFAFLTMISCGSPKTSLENKAKYPARNQCNSSSQTGGKGIVGGEDTMEYSPVIMLLNSENDSIGRCTASFIANNLLISAAHCVPKDEAGMVRILIDDCKNNQTIEIKSEKVWHLGVAGSDFDNPVDLQELAVSDLSIVKLSATPDLGLLNLPTKPAAMGEALIAVGYGKEEPGELEGGFSGYVNAKKKLGKLVMQEVSEEKAQLLSIVSKRPEPAVASGDSGGPLLRDNEIIGIASLGSTEYVEDELTSIWVNLFSSKAFELLSRVQTEIGGIPNWEAYKASFEKSL